MSSKVAIVCWSALMVALLLAVAEGTTYTTTTTVITTVAEEEGNQKQCQSQIQGREFRQCRMYLQAAGGSQSEEMEINPGQMKQTLMQCCQQLRGVDMQCRCDAIKQMMIKGGQGSQQMMMPTAKYLPRICNMGPHICQFQTQILHI